MITPAAQAQVTPLSSLQIWFDAMASGLTEALARAGDALTFLVVHPMSTARGIQLLLENREDTLRRLLMLGSSVRAWQNDPAGLAGDAVAAALYLSSCVLLVWSLQIIAGRVIRALPVGFQDRRLKKRGRRSAVVRLRRARRMRLERRRGERNAGGSFALQRIRWWLRDGVDGLRLLSKQPLTACAFLLEQLGLTVLRVGRRTLRAGWRQAAYLIFPAALFSLPWTQFSVHLDVVDREVQRSVAPVARRYLEEAPDLKLAALRDRTVEVRKRYAEHRERLLDPFRDLETELQQELKALDQRVDSLPEPVLDARLGRVFDRYAETRLLLVDHIFVRATRTSHGPYAPSHNALESFGDEQELLEAAHARVADDESRRYLTEVIAAVAAQRDYEYCVLRYDPKLLAVRPLPASDASCDSVSAEAEAQP